MKTKLKILVVIVTLAFSLSIMSNTYSRYVADANGNVELAFAKWQILVSNEDITNGEVSSIEINPTIIENEHVAQNKLAPSSKGYYDIEIDPTNVETSFTYKITLEDNDMEDLIIDKYSIDDGELLDITDNEITGEFDYEDGFDTFTIRVYFEWYDMEDNNMSNEDDTLYALNNESITIETNISFEQKI